MSRKQNARIAKLLKRLPEVKLSIFDLLWKVTDGKGGVNIDEVMLHQKEIELATQEANRYVSATRKAVRCLKMIISGRIDQEPY